LSPLKIYNTFLVSRSADSDTSKSFLGAFLSFCTGTKSAQRTIVSDRAEELRHRVKSFAIRLLKFVKTLPRDPATSEVAHQLARSGPSVSSNYHSACRARSRREFISKLGLVLEEADESEHWLKLLGDGTLVEGSELDWLQSEASQLRAIFKASVTTARANHDRIKATRSRRRRS
jgi:four helix bundle protein